MNESTIEKSLGINNIKKNGLNYRSESEFFVLTHVDSLDDPYIFTSTLSHEDINLVIAYIQFQFNEYMTGYSLWEEVTLDILTTHFGCQNVDYTDTEKQTTWAMRLINLSPDFQSNTIIDLVDNWETHYVYYELILEMEMVPNELLNTSFEKIKNTILNS